MPPKKVFSGQVDYARNTHDDLFELLHESKNESTQMKKLVSLNPRLKIVDGLYGRENWTRDATTTKFGLFLFKKWFSKRNLFSPHRNNWNFDLVKLVVPVVFVDVDKLMAITQNYDPIVKVVRRFDGSA